VAGDVRSAAEEVALEGLEQLFAAEGAYAAGAAVVLGDDHVVLERRVRALEAVLELVPLPHVVVGARLVGLAMLRVDDAADGPERARPPLDPDHDPFVTARVVASVDYPLGEAPGLQWGLHGGDYTIAPMGLVEVIRGAFSFLSSRSQSEERIAQYVMREHHRGRPLQEILEDNYVTNRCTPEQIKRLLDRPELIHAVGQDVAAEAKTTV
jgi:hypothetical protein